ncbi:hypothetical protein B7R78_0015305 [Ralstonia solanacearum]|uniref:Transmembrane protein n=1 Tax=Ralstonia solanacearum K60 TaxID=1091042 RepID=A0AAP8D5C7_RALSL|nr:hypothetical protein [Ralstonia solanacearum]MBT1538424.1 hypothetical protein [Ralstonia solanacearum]OYQ14678.1 hypothetical protein B7R77_16400 [Ralstonia solanacearum K60]QOK82052.1 hypothetical protein HF906_07705 [Ralstonia solanacearum]RIJ85538.1 hypothetical protein RSP822_15230 [Ralstonia solanacearum]CCF95696.1 conserved membrane hypothetical protein [Ralstonia solanacearum K60]
MALPQFCSLLAAAFAGALIAYVPTARQRNWPVGKLFERGTVPATVYLGVAALLLGETISWAWAGKATWWGVLWIVLATFVGAPLITSLFKSWSAVLSLVAAPTLAMAAALLSLFSIDA